MVKQQKMETAERLIVEQLKRGNDEAYKYLYRHHYTTLCHVAYEFVKDDFMAETLVGDVIFHLWEIRDSLEIHTSLRCYLVRAVRNRCVDYLTSKKERNEVTLSSLGENGQTQEHYILSDEYPLGSLLERELEKAAEAAAEFLDELVSMGADRKEMAERLQEYLLDLEWGLTDEQASELAEWLVDVYLQNYESIYGEPSGVSQTVTEFSDTFLEEMRTDLQNISEYLTQLDASVTNNKEELIHLTEVHDGNYTELTEYLEGLKNVVSTIQSELAGYQDSQSEQQIISTQEFADMKTRMDSLSQAILELENRL